MKPHPSIFDAALQLIGVPARESVMVGDSLTHDIAGARQVGMRGILVRRSADIGPGATGASPTLAFRSSARSRNFPPCSTT